MAVLVELINKSVHYRDKILVFSQSLSTLSCVERILTQRHVPIPDPGMGHGTGALQYQNVMWTKNKHYCRKSVHDYSSGVWVLHPPPPLSTHTLTLTHTHPLTPLSLYSHAHTTTLTHTHPPTPLSLYSHHHTHPLTPLSLLTRSHHHTHTHTCPPTPISLLTRSHSHTLTHPHPSLSTHTTTLTHSPTHTYLSTHTLTPPHSHTLARPHLSLYSHAHTTTLTHTGPPTPISLLTRPFHPSLYSHHPHHTHTGLDGSTSSMERDKLITAFNSPSNVDCWVFLLSTK